MQADHTIMKMRAMYAIIPAVFVGVSWLLTLIYPITEEASCRIQKQLKLKKAELSADQ